MMCASMYKLKAGLTWCLAKQKKLLLLQTQQPIAETEQQVTKNPFLHLILCLLGCCQVLLDFHHFVIDFACSVHQYLQLSVHGSQQQGWLAT